MALNSVATVDSPTGSHDMLLPARKKSLVPFCPRDTDTPNATVPAR